MLGRKMQITDYPSMHLIAWFKFFFNVANESWVELPIQHYKD